MESILITGSNRGLGLAWAEQYAAAGWRVYATCRHPEQADTLHLLDAAYRNLSVHRLDVTREEEIAALAQALADVSIDILLNNAGVYFEKYLPQSLGSIDYRHWQESFNVNTLGPMRVTAAFTEQVARSNRRLVVAITSHMGSIAEIGSPGDYPYRSSKAALNAAMKGLSLELAPRAISVLLLHPGWVQTRMGGPGALLSTDESVSAMRQVVENLRHGDSGHFFRYDGSSIPW
jgi:NAD(P)-dependent dehydrogenase (short-subunit alcohol dehydrogenase family)